MFLANLLGQLFKRRLASVQQNLVLSYLAVKACDAGSEKHFSS